MAQPHDHLNETDEEAARFWAAHLETPERNEPMDETEKTFRWLGLAGFASLTVIALGMNSCEKVSVAEKGKAMAACLDAGGSWLRAGDASFQCLRLGAATVDIPPPLGELP